MMALAMLLPSVFPKWFTPAGDAVLAGGTLEFFAVGTTTPKSVYADYQQLSAIGNVVTLDGAGDATIFLGSGGYKVILKDSLGAQLDLVDGIFGTSGGSAVDSNATYGFFKVYNDLRALATAIDVAYVAGRDEEGDGGEGWLQLQPGVVAHDDDGIFLAAAGGSIEYKRIFDAVINPEWYGVRYAVSVDQSVALLRALNASAAVNFPVLATDRIFLAQNVAAPVGASLVTGQDAYFQANASVSLTFQAGTRFDGRGVAFSGTVQPIFAAGTVDAIRLSWMGGTGAEKWTRLLASTVATIPVLMDESTSLTSGLTIPASLPLEPVGGAVVTFNGAAWLEVGTLNFRSAVQWAAFAVDTYVGNVAIGSDVCYMEWFGGSPSNTGEQNAIPFKCCMKAQRLDLMGGSVTYTVTSTNPLAYSNPGVVQFVGNSSTININQDLDITVVETNQITIGGSGTFNVGAGVFRNSLIIMKLTGGAKSARNSQLSDVDKIAQSNDSTIYGGLTAIEGRLDNCTITLPGTVAVNDSYTFTGCKFTKSEAQHLPAFSFPVTQKHQIFQSCSFDIDGALLYSENTSLVVDLVACTDSDNWAKGIHNGFATVNLVGCNCRGNSTATTVDGVGQQLFDPVIATRKPGMRIDIPSQVVTSSLTGWKGVNVGTLSTDGLAIIIGTATALGSSPWDASTLRFAGSGSGLASPMGLMDQVWRYGGQMTLKVEYPVGVAPDPATKIKVAFVQPKIGLDPIIYRVSHQVLGQNTSAPLAPIAGAKSKNYVNIWGGQVTMKTPNVGGGWDATDEWGDVPQALALDTAISGIPRIVIYNEGSGLIPVGTKITLDLGAYMPTTEQYKAYWPETPFGILIGDAIQSVRQVPYNLGGPWKTPYCFRSGDANGVEIALNRVDYDAYPSPPTMVNLPVTVWANGTTLNGSYS